MDISNRWSSAVAWLKRKMNDYGWVNVQKDSNNLATNKQFQRTISAQKTLEKATAMLATKVGSGWGSIDCWTDF